MNSPGQKSTRPTAVALRYNGNGAPRLTAKGCGETAERILELARRHGIPIQHDQALVELLAQVKLGEEIPPVLYAVVAELLSFVYSLTGAPPIMKAGEDGQ